MDHRSLSHKGARNAPTACPVRSPRIREILSGASVMPKLRIGEPGNAAEREADRAADQVIRMPADGLLRRQSESEEEELLQTAPRPGSEPAPGPEAETAVAALQGGGRPMGAAERAFFEPRFGLSFGDVTLHTGPRADAAARAVGARAFALGSDIAFAQGEYRPGSVEGRRLIAHELTHVGQGRRAIGHILRRETARARRARLARGRQERQMIRHIADAIRLLASAQGDMAGVGLPDILAFTTQVAEQLVAQRYGVYDAEGQRDPSHDAQAFRLRQTFRRGQEAMGRPSEFRIWLYVSHQSGPSTPAGTYTPAGTLGGRLTFFINTFAGRPLANLAGNLAHEFFHLWAHYQRVIRERHGPEAAAEAPSHALAAAVDPSAFASHRRRMETHFERLIHHLNDVARGRGDMLIHRHRIPSEVATDWGRRVVEEMGAYIYETCVSTAVAAVQARAAGPGTGGGVVGMGRGFSATEFLNNYIREYWLHDADDRAALLRPAGQRIIRGMAGSVNALEAAVRRRMRC